MMQDKKYEKSKLQKIGVILYVMMFITIVLTLLYLSLQNKNKNSFYETHEAAQFPVQIFEMNGSPITDTIHLNDYADNGHGYLVFYVPVDLPDGYSLCFGSKHLYFTLYYGDEPTVIYKTDYSDSRFYTASAGTQWHTPHLPDDIKGSYIFMEYQTAYDSGKAGIYNMSYQYADGFYMNLIHTKLLSVIACILYLLLGVAMLFMHLIIQKAMHGKSSLLWLGALATSVACYCLMETQIPQIFMSDQRLVHLCVMLSMSMIPMPAIMFTDSLLKFRHRKLAFMLCILYGILFFVMFGLNAFNIVDYHIMLPVLQGMIGTAIVFLGVRMMTYLYYSLKNDRKITIYTGSMIGGLISVILTGFTDIVRYWFWNNNDPARYTKFGFLLFIIFFIIASSGSAIEAYKTAMKTEMISKLAYEDGLTGLLNRTSYQEDLKNLENEHKNAGIIMMDLNNLKFVNDTFGHDDGDDMLVDTANILRRVFQDGNNKIYRIGGDEFVAIIADLGDPDILDVRCADYLHKLKDQYSEYNVNTMTRYKIVIAAGYSVFYNYKFDSIEDVVKTADTKMYTNKKQLKSETRFANIMV